MQLRLAVRCRSTVAAVQGLLHLARRCRLVGVSFQQHAEDEDAAAAVHALLSDAGFQQVAAVHLTTLLGAPCSAEGGKSAAGRSTLQHFSPAPFPRLRRLQLYTPPHQQVLSLRNPAWQAATALRHLSISGRHYLALRVLPPNLRRLEVSAWHVLAEPQLLVQCPQVCCGGMVAVLRCLRLCDRGLALWLEKQQVVREMGNCGSKPTDPAFALHNLQVHILAAAVLTTEHVLPYFAAGAAPTAVERQLAQLAQLLATAGLAEGHCITLDTNLVCWQCPSDGSEVKLAAPAADALLVAAAAGAASWQLKAVAGTVEATMAAPPAHSLWPALGPNAPSGSGPEMRVVVQNR